VGSGLMALVVVKTSSTSWLTLNCRGAMGAIAKTLGSAAWILERQSALTLHRAYRAGLC
jgi:hypothetical protein